MSIGLTGSLQNSLPGLLLAGWGPLGTFLPSLIAGMEFAAIYLPLQVVLAHPPHRLSHSSWGRQPTLLVAGYSVFKVCGKVCCMSFQLLGHQKTFFRHLFVRILKFVKTDEKLLSDLCLLPVQIHSVSFLLSRSPSAIQYPNRKAPSLCAAASRP